MKNIALIDNDFIQHLAEAKGKTQVEKETIVLKVFDSLNIQAQMHELLHKHEFQDYNNAKQFFDHGLFSVLTLDSVFSESEDKKAYYCKLVPELYKMKFGERLDIANVLTQWRSNCSLGEIHSLAACMVGGFGIFLSDDHDSKSLNRIIRTQCHRRIAVYNRDDLYHKLEPGTLNKSERKALISHKS